VFINVTARKNGIYEYLLRVSIEPEEYPYDQSGNPCVALIISKNAFVETGDTHDLYPGVALSPERARLVIARIQDVVREIEGA
jgi:hypothetical protein